MPPPDLQALLAIQTSFSFGRGTVSPARWATWLAQYYGEAAPTVVVKSGRRPAPPASGTWRGASGQGEDAGSREPSNQATKQPSNSTAKRSKQWAILADNGDLAALPACCEHWGHERVIPGATLDLDGDGPLALLLAPSELGYANLCTWLSWRHEHDDEWQAWLADTSTNAPSCDGVIWLVRANYWWYRLRRCGIECHWWDDGSGTQAPDHQPGVAINYATAMTAEDEAAAVVLGGKASGEAIAGCRLWAAGPEDDVGQPVGKRQIEQTFSQQALANADKIRQRCRYVPAVPDAKGNPPLHMPPAHFIDPAQKLRQLAVNGVLRRYGNDPSTQVWQRLEQELAVIIRKNFASYVLAVWDLARGRRTCGRGSAASSLVCYALGLTNVDPVRYQLVFERFLSDERYDPPDIDIDFPWDERDAVLAATFERYGDEHVAMVSTHQHRSHDGAVREVARETGIDRETITAAKHTRRRVQRTGGDEPTCDQQWRTIYRQAALITDLPRHFGLHCGGVVITTRPIRELVPIHLAAKQINGRPVAAIAWEKDGAERMGLVKIDFLGNRALAVVRDCLADLCEHGITIDEARWHPQDDPLARQLIERGDTIGCFYIESPAMRLLNAKAGHVDFDRLVVHSSIIRPAANQWIERYLERLHKWRETGDHDPAWYPHPVLHGLLSESFGILSYQEDVMLVARELAGFDIVLQNKLRKSLGRTDTPQRLATLADAFNSGCRRHQVPDDVRDLVWSMISSFAGYSFCKAHSASYAMVSYQCAFLKAHHPAVFLARVIANGGGFYNVAAYVEEARRHGIHMQAPCVCVGERNTRAINADTIQLGLCHVTQVSHSTITRIIKQRQQQPFRSVHDLRQRCHVASNELRMLLWSGALNALHPDASSGQRSWLTRLASRAPLLTTNHIDDQLTLPVESNIADKSLEFPELPQRLRDRRSWQALTCLPRCHPFALWSLPTTPLHCGHIDHRWHGRDIELITWTITRKQVWSTQHKDLRGRPLAEPLQRPMAFVTLEDHHAILESVWFADVYQRDGDVLDHGTPFIVGGRIQSDHNVVTCVVHYARAIHPTTSS